MRDGTPACSIAPTDVPAFRRRGARPLVEDQLEALGQLVGIGLKIARGIERQVDGAGEAPQPIADLNAAAIAFARVARAVRQTLMLQSKLQEARGVATGGGADRKDGVARIVRRAIEDEYGKASEVERLTAEAAERLEHEFGEDGLVGPVGAIVADICRALGLAPNWRDLAADIAALEAEGAAADPGDDEPGEICWIGDDGRWTPVSQLFPGRFGTGHSAPSRIGSRLGTPAERVARAAPPPSVRTAFETALGMGMVAGRTR